MLILYHHINIITRWMNDKVKFPVGILNRKQFFCMSFIIICPPLVKIISEHSP